MLCDEGYNRMCACTRAKSLQLCLPLCDPMNCSPLGSSVHGILQATILERVVMPSSRGDNRIAANIPTRTRLCASHALTHWIPHIPFVVYNRLKICDREIIQSTNDKRKLGSVKVWADALQPGAWRIGTARLSSVSTRARGKRQGTQGKWDLIKKLKVGYYFVDLGVKLAVE